MSDRQPLQRPLRVKSKYKWLEGKEFPVDDQGTKKLLRDCTEEERQFIVDSGSDNIFAREQPRNYRAEAFARARVERQQGADDDDLHRGAINLDH
jgi:hypothetical protein